jgi:phage terminase Nu1 subunit (DNA packaging protein)
MGSKNGASLLNAVITLSDLATLTVQSERNVQRLVKSGMIRLARDRHGRQLKGHFVLGESVPRVCEHLRDQATADDPHETLYRSARARKMEALATSEEMRVALERGELISRSAVLNAMSNILRATRDRFRAIPTRLMHPLQAMNDKMQIRLLLSKEIDATLTNLADSIRRCTIRERTQTSSRNDRIE